MKFNYKARTKDGTIQTGVIEASSREGALTLLQDHGFYVTELKETKDPFWTKIKIFQKTDLKDLSSFSRQLSMMFDAKVSLIESLKALGEQTRNSVFQDTIFSLAEEVEGGMAFSKALALHPDVFSVFYVSMIKAGEASGKVSGSLNYLADYLEREQDLNSKTQGALIYPAAILSLSFLVIGAMIYMVIPQLKGVLEDSGAQIPELTSTILSVSDGMRANGPLIIIISIVMIVFGLRYYKTEKGKNSVDSFLLKVPIVGNFLRTTYLSRISMNLSTLISGGLMITQAIELSAEVVGSIKYREALLSVRNGVRKGMPMSSILSSFPDLFPPIFIQMTMVGEKTGNLDESLMRVADFYQKEVGSTITKMLNLLEPALIIFLGVVVGGLMFSILMPLYEVMSV